MRSGLLKKREANRIQYKSVFRYYLILPFISAKNGKCIVFWRGTASTFKIKRGNDSNYYNGTIRAHQKKGKLSYSCHGTRHAFDKKRKFKSVFHDSIGAFQILYGLRFGTVNAFHGVIAKPSQKRKICFIIFAFVCQECPLKTESKRWN